MLDVKLISHRGLHGEFPENAISSIQSLIQKGIHGVEIDLRTTKDGHIVLMHDERLERTTTGKGRVDETLWKEIRDLKLKSPDGSPTSESVPDFKTALQVIKGHPDFGLALDLKAVDAVEVAGMVMAQGMQPQVLFSIADPMNTQLAKSLKRLDSKLRISVNMLTWWKIEDVPLFAARALDADSLFASEWFFPKCGFKGLAQEGIPVVVYLRGRHDLEKRFRQAVRLGVKGVSCDDPLSLLPLVRPASHQIQ
ncbi:GlpQ: glycerophosphoryl diester phosphodiesterase [Desulfosarcina variabilis str. Montpellier]